MYYLFFTFMEIYLMKARLFALTFTALAVNSAQSTVVYEKDGTRVSMSGSLRVFLAKQGDSRWDLLNNQSRIWLNVSQNVGDGFQFFGATQIRPQTQYDDNFSSGVYVHRLFMGIKNYNIGEISFGNLYTTANYFKLADFTEKFGGITPSGVLSPGIDYDTKALGTYRTYGRPQYGMSTSTRKGVHFSSRDWNGLVFRADYMFAGDASKEKYNNNGYQAGLFFKRQFDDVLIKTNLVYGFKHITEFTHPKSANFGGHYNTRSYGVAFGLTYRDFTLGMDYMLDKSSAGDDFNYKSNTQNAFQVGLKYYITYPWDIYTAYRQTKYMVSDYAGKGKPKDFYYVRNKGFALGSHYQLTRMVRVFVEYATNKPEGDKKYPNRQHGYYTGFRVNF